MLPKEEHLKQIERFYNLIESTNKRIEMIRQKIINPADPGDELLDELHKYFVLTTKIWTLVDNCIEQIKDTLDEFENYPKNF